MLAVAVGVVPAQLEAQEEEKGDNEEELTRVWRIDGLRTGFCVQLLVNPGDLRVSISRNARPLRADAIENLSPVLKTVLSHQPEYGGWTPSRICLYYMTTVDVGSLTVTERDPSKALMIGVWTLAAADAVGGRRRDLVLRFFTNSGRLERAGQVNGLDMQTVRSRVRDTENENDPSAPPIGTRYEIKLEETLLTWDGRRASDSTRANGSQSVDWRADSRRRGPLTARLVLTPTWTQPMVGSLRVEGEDDLAKAIKASPIRFVGPAMLGGVGQFAFGR
jgi:hypothetical protein